MRRRREPCAHARRMHGTASSLQFCELVLQSAREAASGSLRTGVTELGSWLAFSVKQVISGIAAHTRRHLVAWTTLPLRRHGHAKTP